jgi:hypothetical protein
MPKRGEMIWVLRNISIRLWIGTLLGIPFSFFLMSNINHFVFSIHPIAVVLIVVFFFSFLAGFLMDITGRRIIEGLIKESEIWERAGLFNKAQQKYVNALRIFDTFLFSPFWSGKTLKLLSGSMAKFNLSSSTENKSFRMATAAYLKMNPMDIDIAGSWLEYLYKTKQVSSLEQEVLTVLADIHYANEKINGVLADIFWGLERKDFTAKKLYQGVLGDSSLNGKYENRVKELVGIKEKAIPEPKIFPKP